MSWENSWLVELRPFSGPSPPLRAHYRLRPFLGQRSANRPGTGANRYLPVTTPAPGPFSPWVLFRNTAAANLCKFSFRAAQGCWSQLPCSSRKNPYNSLYTNELQTSARAQTDPISSLSLPVRVPRQEFPQCFPQPPWARGYGLFPCFSFTFRSYLARFPVITP